MLKVVLLLALALNFQFIQPVKASGDLTIKVLREGFVPKNLVINNGQTVIFVNEDINSHWPASNIHPTHGIYPEFDPQKAIEPGKSWQFKFEKPGTFRFHDHLYPELTGTIKVTGAGAEAVEKIPGNSRDIFIKKIFYFFFPFKLKQDLAAVDAIKITGDEENLAFWISLIGGRKFMEELISDSEGGSKIDCHQEAHLAGRIAYSIEGIYAFQKPSYSCHSGFIHGAMESFLQHKGVDNITLEVESLCNGFPTDFSKFECLHGIGHGFMAYLDYDIPDALKLCRSLSGDYSKRSCFGGVFMENIMVAQGKGALKGHETRWISPDPHFPCNGVDPGYLVQFECYQMQTSRMLQLSDYSFEYISSQCQKAPENMAEVCFKSMGRDVAGQTLRDPEKIITSCKLAPQEYFKDCLAGALNVIIDFWGENIIDQPQKLCFALEKKDKNFCYELLGDRLKGIFPGDIQVNLQDFIFFSDPYGSLFNAARTLTSFGNQSFKIRQICSQFEDEYVNLCLNGST